MTRLEQIKSRLEKLTPNPGKRFPEFFMGNHEMQLVNEYLQFATDAQWDMKWLLHHLEKAIEMAGYYASQKHVGEPVQRIDDALVLAITTENGQKARDFLKEIQGSSVGREDVC